MVIDHRALAFDLTMLVRRTHVRVYSARSISIHRDVMLSEFKGCSYVAKSWRVGNQRRWKAYPRLESCPGQQTCWRSS